MQKNNIAKKADTKTAPIKDTKRQKSVSKDEKVKAKPKDKENTKKSTAEDKHIAPKRNKNGYMFFLAEAREKLKKDNSELKGKEVLTVSLKLFFNLIIILF